LILFCLYLVKLQKNLTPREARCALSQTLREMLSTPSGLVNEVVLDMIWVKHWEYKSWITFKSLSLEMWKLHEYICLVKYFHKSIHMSVFNKYFYKKKKSKLYFGDRVVVLNDFIYQTGGSIYIFRTLCSVSIFYLVKLL
jgi:hypothetical protein